MKKSILCLQMDEKKHMHRFLGVKAGRNKNVKDALCARFNFLHLDCEVQRKIDVHFQGSYDTDYILFIGMEMSLG